MPLLQLPFALCFQFIQFAGPLAAEFRVDCRLTFTLTEPVLETLENYLYTWVSSSNVGWP